MHLPWIESMARLIEDPPPAHVFEVSAGGIAWAVRGKTPATGFRPLEAGVLAVSPMRDNVLQPDVLEREFAAVAPAIGQRKRRPAALILPDYSTRVTVLEFESFPADRAEQLSLVRFRMKKAVPFDLEAASIGFQARPADKKRQDVVAAAAPLEVVARYEAPLRAAGYEVGFVTTSMLAAMDLIAGEGLAVAAKLSGRVLTVTLSQGERLRLLRCVEPAESSIEEVLAVLFPTLAYAEDEMPSRPQKLLVCGFGDLTAPLMAACERELGLRAESMQSPWGAPNGTNAGLYGYLKANGAN